MDRTTATVIGASVGAVVGVVAWGKFTYDVFNKKYQSSNLIAGSLLLAPPVVGGAIGYYASK